METGSLLEAITWFSVRCRGQDFRIERGEQLILLAIEKQGIRYKRTQPNYLYTCTVLTRVGIASVSYSTILAQTVEVK
jgi:hypothetical protein